MIPETEADGRDARPWVPGMLGYPDTALLTGTAWDPDDGEAIDHDQHGTSR
jgi:hypothetical protein